MGITQPMHFSATYLGANGWLIEIGQLKVLIDPWLTGSLAFSPGPWLIKGELNNPISMPKNLDLVLLTQGQADHCHPATLKCLPQSLPLIGSGSAVKVAKQLGFSSTFSLSPGEIKQIGELKIEATKGAPVPMIENGYLIEHPDASFYIEPHGYLDEDIIPKKLDAVFSPVLNLNLPLVGSFIKGKAVLPKLISRFKPEFILASTTGGDVTFTGLLTRAISTEGGLEEAEKIINGKSILIDPCPGKRYFLSKKKLGPS